MSLDGVGPVDCCWGVADGVSEEDIVGGNEDEGEAEDGGVGSTSSVGFVEITDDGLIEG